VNAGAEQRLVGLLGEAMGFGPKALDPAALDAVADRWAPSLEGMEASQLRNERTLSQQIFAELSVGETYFFRQFEHFELLRKLIGEGRFAGRPGPFRAWSAGCASGEEAWSLAAMLKDCLPQSPQVLGTDLLDKSVQEAEKGLYGKWSNRSGQMSAYPVVSAGTGGSFEVNAELRDGVRFLAHNLLEPLPQAEGSFDLIFCRNVLVYFSPQAAKKAVANLVSRLAEGGLLFFSNTDLTFKPDQLDPVGPAGLKVFEAARPQKASNPPPKPSVASPPSVPIGLASVPIPKKTEAKTREHHLDVLRLRESGGERDATDRLASLVIEFPDYVPGLLENALHLHRQSKRGQACDWMRKIRQQLRSIPSDTMLDGPESLAASYYNNIAGAYLAQHQSAA
jgi:chemotaxis protein methyltransferase CheR